MKKQNQEQRGNQGASLMDADFIRTAASEWCKGVRESIINEGTYKQLVNEFNKKQQDPDYESQIVARWFSLDGVDYFGMEISPERPSVVFGCVMLPPDMGSGWEFSTFWVIREEGNPFSHGEALEDQRIPILVNDIPVELPRWELDLFWEPIGFKELSEKVEANGGCWK